MTAAYLNAMSVVCALGRDHASVSRRVFTGESGVVMTDAFTPGRTLALGPVDGALPSMADWPLEYRCRNNALASIAADALRDEVAAAIARFGASRVAVVVGTSTSGIAESERALDVRRATGALPGDYVFAHQELGTLADFLAYRFGVAGPAHVHSSACASSAKAMAAGARLLLHGYVDAVITGGVDALSAFTILGFGSLELLSARRTNALSLNRDGINLGEAAALFVMTREPGPVRLAGWGESSDGYHFSAPDPKGVGARIAVEGALARAGVAAGQLDYVNLHGTGTRANDLMECAVVAGLVGTDVPVSSTKPLTGHTLGAAGALEAAICWLAMSDGNRVGALPAHLWDGVGDPELARLRIAVPGTALGAPPRRVLSTSFAFGGANAALIFARE